MIQLHRWATGLICLPLLLSPVFAEPLHREQRVLPLPGHLDAVPMVNDNNPELIEQDGILLSTFSGTSQDSSIDVTLNGRFDLFSHHVYAGNDDSLESTLWLALHGTPGQHPRHTDADRGQYRTVPGNRTGADRRTFSAPAGTHA